MSSGHSSAAVFWTQRSSVWLHEIWMRPNHSTHRVRRGPLGAIDRWWCLGKEGSCGLVYELHSKRLVYTMRLWTAQLDSIEDFFLKKKEELKLGRGGEGEV